MELIMNQATTTPHPGLLAGTQPEMWRRVMERDARADGEFFFAVRSTGVYCRPSCPSRRPKQENVVFFARREEAEQSGFRPCLRCRPRDAAAGSTALIESACRIIQQNLEEPLTLPVLAAKVGLSQFHLQRQFKRVLGVSPREYADALRMERFKRRVRGGDSVTDALYNAGYGSSRGLYERAGKHLGMSPAAYRKGGRDARIAFTTALSPLGRVLVATTARGVCAIRVGDSEAGLKRAFLREFPAAEVRRDVTQLRRAVAEVVRYVSGERTQVALPLDIQATAFQRRVWEALRRIPRGQTRSYADVARAIGKPRAARAVARACATNPVAIAIPCHRVVQKGGGLGGYRWGTRRKAALLAREGAR